MPDGLVDNVRALRSSGHIYGGQIVIDVVKSVQLYSFRRVAGKHDTTNRIARHHGFVARHGRNILLCEVEAERDTPGKAQHYLVSESDLRGLFVRKNRVCPR